MLFDSCRICLKTQETDRRTVRFSVYILQKDRGWSDGKSFKDAGSTRGSQTPYSGDHSGLLVVGSGIGVTRDDRDVELATNSEPEYMSVPSTMRVTSKFPIQTKQVSRVFDKQV